MTNGVQKNILKKVLKNFQFEKIIFFIFLDEIDRHRDNHRHFKYEESSKRFETNLKVEVSRERIERIEIDSKNRSVASESKDRKSIGNSLKNERDKDSKKDKNTVRITKEEISKVKVETSSKLIDRKIVKVEKEKLKLDESKKHDLKDRLKEKENAKKIKKSSKHEEKYKYVRDISPPKAYDLNLNRSSSSSSNSAGSSISLSPKERGKRFSKVSTSSLSSHDEDSPVRKNYEEKKTNAEDLRNTEEKNQITDTDSEGMCSDVSVHSSPNQVCFLIKKFFAKYFIFLVELYTLLIEN